MPELKGIGVELNAIVMKACAFSRHERYESPTEMRRALEAVAVNKEEKEAEHITASAKYFSVDQQGNILPQRSSSQRRNKGKNKGWRIPVLCSGVLAIIGVIVLIVVLNGLFRTQGLAQGSEVVDSPDNEKDYDRPIVESDIPIVENDTQITENDTPIAVSDAQIVGKWARGSYIFNFWDLDIDVVPVNLGDPTGEAGWGIYFKDNDQYLEYRSGEIVSDDGIVKKYLTIISGNYRVIENHTIGFSNMKVYSRQNIGEEVMEYWPKYADYELPFEISDDGNTFTFLDDYENRGLRQFQKIN